MPIPMPYTNYQMPSYMDSLDLSDISDYEDCMVTSGDEEIPGIGGSTILIQDSGLIEHCFIKLTLGWSLPSWTLP